MNINARLKKIIDAVDCTQAEFAESIGTTPATLSRQLNGVHKIDKQVALSIQAVYNIDHNWLLTGEGVMFLVPSIPERKKDGETACGDPRIKKISRLLADNPEMITITDKFLSGSATLKELVEAAEGLPEKRRKVALMQIKALESC